MLVTRIQEPRTGASFQHRALETVSERRLRASVEALAFPRHFRENRKANRTARDWLVEELRCLGYRVELQGAWDNVITNPAPGRGGSPILLGSHYDTVPGTPGADDNNSAIAVCLEAARVLALQGGPCVQVAVFNREEDGLMGSSDFVGNMRHAVSETHIFEMVGYFDTRPGSQSKPAGLPISLPATGDFIGVVSNGASSGIASAIQRAARRVGSATALVSLKTYLGIERLFGDLLRSDHTPFWRAGLPAVMWTDTSNFRNPNYHLPSDTPATLDYGRLADVTRMVVGHILLRDTRKDRWPEGK